MKRISWILSVLLAVGLPGCDEDGDDSQFGISSGHEDDEKTDNNDNSDHNSTNPDGNQTNPDGNQTNPDGNQTNPDENQSNPDGNQTNPDGNQTNPDGNQTNPDGNQSNPIVDACNNRCKSDEICLYDGTCLKKCPSGQTRCGDECLNFYDLHLASCDACAEGYCDSDNNVRNGCDINVMVNDPENCGACGKKCDDGLTCVSGQCLPMCVPGAEWCDQECIVLKDLHLKRCDACEDNYCDTDNKKVNGCESYALGEDMNNCGACGKKCNGACVAGQCVQSSLAMVMKDLSLTANADGSGGNVASAAKYDYVKVLEEQNGKSKVSLNNKIGWVSTSALMDACEKCEGRKAVDLAEKYLYSKTHLCTYDFLTHEPHIDNFTDFASLGAYANWGYDRNCANFVSAILITAGLARHGSGAVDIMRQNIINYDGYHLVNDFSQAKPGDVWNCGYEQHAEMVVGYYNGSLVLIGSNNYQSYDRHDYCAQVLSTDPTEYQSVRYDSSSWCSKDQYLISRQ